MTTPAIIALALETGVVCFYGYWLNSKRPLTWPYWLPIASLVGSFICVVLINFYAFHKAEISGYKLDESEYYSHDSLLIPSYREESWALYVSALGPLLGLFLMQWILPKSARLMQSIHLLGLWLFFYLPAIALLLLWLEGLKPMQHA